jgi:hypothetical protein
MVIIPNWYVFCICLPENMGTAPFFAVAKSRSSAPLVATDWF